MEVFALGISKEKYKQMADNAGTKSPVLMNCVKAFLFGGTICLFGQGLNELFKIFEMTEKEITAATPCTIIVITAILTGIGVFDKIARHAGAGTIVPITGFANSVVSPALEFNREGLVLGTAAQMFSIAGPVLVYGISASVIYGIIIYIIQLY